MPRTPHICSRPPAPPQHALSEPEATGHGQKVTRADCSGTPRQPGGPQAGWQVPTQLLGTNCSSPAGWARGPRCDPPNSWGVWVGDPTSRPRPPSPASEFFPICHSHSQKHGAEAHLKLDLGQEGLIKKKKKMDVLKTIYKNKFHLHLYFERATLSRDAKFKNSERTPRKSFPRHGPATQFPSPVLVCRQR